MVAILSGNMSEAVYEAFYATYMTFMALNPSLPSETYRFTSDNHEHTSWPQWVDVALPLELVQYPG